MQKFQIITDGTREGTQIIMDGEDLTNDPDVLVTDISFYAEAGGDYVSISYTTLEQGEDGSRISVKYSYSNAEWMSSPGSSPKGMGHMGMDDAHIGGRILQDVSGVSKAERLLLKKGVRSKK